MKIRNSRVRKDNEINIYKNKGDNTHSKGSINTINYRP